MTNDDFNQMVYRVFNERYNVRVAPIYEDMVNPVPHVETPTVIDDCNGLRVEVDNAYDNFVAQYMASSIDMTGDEEEDTRRAYTPEERALPLTTIASILTLGGQIDLITPADSTQINARLGQYLGEVHRRQCTEPNYQGPPNEDIESLENLQAELAPLVEIIRRHGQGLAAWDMVLSNLSLGGGRRVGRLAVVDRGEDEQPPPRQPAPEIDPYKF